MDVAQAHLLEEVVDGPAPGEGVVVDPRQQGLEHLLLLGTQTVVLQVAQELGQGQLAEVLGGSHVGEAAHSHLLGLVPQALAVEDVRQADHAQAVVGAELPLEEQGAGLHQAAVVQHGRRLHQGKHHVHGDGDAARVDVVHDAHQHVRRDALEVHTALAALQEVAAEHGPEVGAAGDQDAAVARDLPVLSAQQHVGQDALLAEEVELGQEEGGKLKVFEGKHVTPCLGHPFSEKTEHYGREG